MNFEDAIKVNGKATYNGELSGYVEFNEEDILVDENKNQQFITKAYFDDNWEVYEEPRKTLSGSIDKQVVRDIIMKEGYNRKTILLRELGLE